MQHPTIWKFIEALRKLQNLNKNKIKNKIKALCAQGQPAKRRKYKDLDARLKTIVEDFANRDILDFDIKIKALCAQGQPAKRRKYKDLDARLKTIVEDFANRDILDFLRGIAHNLQFVQ